MDGVLKVGKKDSIWAGKEELYLHMDRRTTIKLPYTYLRDLCQCVVCKDQHSKQRSFRTSDIPKDIAPSSVNWNGSKLSVKWANDIGGSQTTHESTWDRDFLKKPIFNTHRQHWSSNSKPIMWGRDQMDRSQHWVSYSDYIADDSKFASAMQNLQRLGLIFVKDVPGSRSMVEAIATRMGPLRNTFYGSTFDVRTVPQATNIAYTNQFLGFHMDLMYMNEPPGYQLLHCLENSCSGGESLFADTFSAAKLMKEHYPEDYPVLREQRLGYEYRHKEHIYYNERPVFEHDADTGELDHVNYSPPFQSPLPPGDGEGHDAGLVNKLRDALAKFTSIIDNEKHIFELKLNPGDCVIFDNRRIVHARRQFNASVGSRWLAGAYVDTDALLSRFAVCRNQHPHFWTRKAQKALAANNGENNYGKRKASEKSKI
ncbi:Gamma-butyrobetaine hydroxylase subfamily, putative [Penicillium digitatum PHI26]|uniref:Gamma-butyrobetaine hydroxylase subfamily, putative n=3 Tax=Penicillium digitatum TaxID=36651 RepID=K9FE51_PEND2|nr:Gamma-butyrobetaine hydroxylase subfamily, putative [Penicillium digitatum Pd1]EKV06417.1 Gamma-butyrobetaine hydroxylase subfamily, putative [Penicillium digitatum PHI26]EKV21586.1 Gamma-butyrobetaine hydroxylase subfamily, putative [Penicillium digitatum Pd1]